MHSEIVLLVKSTVVEFSFAISSSSSLKHLPRGYQMKTSKRTALTVQEQHVLLEYLKDSSNYYSKYYDLIAVLLGTGLRVGEFMGLTWDEIDLLITEELNFFSFDR